MTDSPEEFRLCIYTPSPEDVPKGLPPPPNVFSTAWHLLVFHVLWPIGLFLVRDDELHWLVRWMLPSVGYLMWRDDYKEMQAKEPTT